MSIESSPALSCCSQLAQHLGAVVSFNGNTTYTKSQSSYWSLQESGLVPQCIVIPNTPEDVAVAISIITITGGCQFAIKGQTHAPAAGFANIEGGVTIDMTNLNTVTLNADHSVASLGGGASWLDVYAYLEPFGVQVAGGRNGAVGVGGLTLGGGISHFTARVGWACDNVLNYQIVLASGELANVNASSNPNLFRALKGGGNNFGVVTRFDFATFPQGQFTVSTIVNSITERNAVFEAFIDITNAPTFDPFVSLVTGLVFNSTSKQWLLSNAAVYTKPEANPEALQNLVAVPSISNTTITTNLSTYANESATPPLNWLFWTGTYNASTTLLSQTFDVLNDTLYNFDVPEGIIWSIAFEPLPTLITSYAADKGGNSLGTSPANGNAYVMLLSALWPDPMSNDIVQNTARQLGNRINNLAESQDSLHTFQYINYADPSQNPLQSYGAQNFESLVATSRKYDPNGVFQRQLPGGFKLM